MSKGRGEIWPEYWIDCCKCDHHQALAMRKAPAVEARKQGWTRHGGMVGPWICQICKAKETLSAHPPADGGAKP